MNTWNTKRYSSRTLSVFEITGAYFANIFYNHLYIKAKDRHNISSRSGYSLTDEYKAAVSAYKHGITKDKKSYEQTVKDLLQYYRTVTKFITASMNDFIETILQQFIPEEHYVTLNDNEKFFFMNKILSTIVTNAASDMVSMKYLELIIDLRHEDNSISMCKDRIVEIQCLERDNMFSKFIKQEIGASNGKKSRSKQHKELLEESEKIDINLCKQLREDCETLYQKYQELLMAKCELETAENRAKKIAETLHAEIFKLSEENSRLKKELSEYKGAKSGVSGGERFSERSLERFSDRVSVVRDHTSEKSAEKPQHSSASVRLNKSAEKKQTNDIKQSATKQPPQKQQIKQKSSTEPVKEEVKNTNNTNNNRRKKSYTQQVEPDPTENLSDESSDEENSNLQPPSVVLHERGGDKNATTAGNNSHASNDFSDDSVNSSGSDSSTSTKGEKNEDEFENPMAFKNLRAFKNKPLSNEYENSPFLQDLE